MRLVGELLALLRSNWYTVCIRTQFRLYGQIYPLAFRSSLGLRPGELIQAKGYIWPYFPPLVLIRIQYLFPGLLRCWSDVAVFFLLRCWAGVAVFCWAAGLLGWWAAAFFFFLLRRWKFLLFSFWWATVPQTLNLLRDRSKFKIKFGFPFLSKM